MTMALEKFVFSGG